MVFVDLVAFTALTDVHGDAAGADAASTLVTIARRSLTGESRLVKSLGDGVLVIAGRPQAGLVCAAAIVEALHDLDDGSDARGGLHHGPVVERGGDVFGSTVNMAARLAAHADPGRLVVTRPVAVAVADVELSAAPLGPVALRGFREPVELFAIDPCQHEGQWLADPVCGMRIEAASAFGRVLVGGRDLGFCSRRCADLYRHV